MKCIEIVHVGSCTACGGLTPELSRREEAMVVRPLQRQVNACRSSETSSDL